MIGLAMRPEAQFRPVGSEVGRLLSLAPSTHAASFNGFEWFLIGFAVGLLIMAKMKR